MSTQFEQHAERDSDVIGYVEKQESKHWTELERIADDARYSDAHKVEQVERLAAAAEIALEQAIAGELDSLKDDTPYLKRARRQIAPDAADQPAVAYLVEYLKARAGETDTLLALWQGAIDAHDLPLLRAFDAVGPALLPGEMSFALRASTEKLLTTPDVLKAQYELVKRANTRRALQAMRDTIPARFRNVTVRGGQLVERARQRLSI